MACKWVRSYVDVGIEVVVYMAYVRGRPRTHSTMARHRESVGIGLAAQISARPESMIDTNFAPWNPTFRGIRPSIRLTRALNRSGERTSSTFSTRWHYHRIRRQPTAGIVLGDQIIPLDFFE